METRYSNCSPKVNKSRGQLGTIKSSSCSEPTCSSLAPIQCECELQPKFCSRHFKQHAASCPVHQHVRTQSLAKDSPRASPPAHPPVRKHELFPQKGSDIRPVSELYKRLASEQAKAEPKVEVEAQPVESSSPSEISSSDSMILIEASSLPQPESKPAVPVKFASAGEERLGLSLEALLKQFRKLELGYTRYKYPTTFGSVFCGQKQPSDGISLEVLGKLIRFGQVQFDNTDEFQVQLLEWSFLALGLPQDLNGWRLLQSQPQQLTSLNHAPLALYLFVLLSLMLPTKARTWFKHASLADLPFFEVLCEATAVFLKSATPAVSEEILQDDPLLSYALYFAAVLSVWLSFYLQSYPQTFAKVSAHVLSKARKKRTVLSLFGKQLFFVTQLS